jgi:hypothetical protein
LICFYCQSFRQIALRSDVVRSEADGSLKLVNRLVNSTLFEKSNAKIDVCVGVIRVETYGRLKLVDGFVNLCFREEGDAEVEVGILIIGFQMNGFLKLADCILGLALVQEGLPQIDAGDFKIRFQADGSLVLADRLTGLVLLVEGLAEIARISGRYQHALRMEDIQRLPQRQLASAPRRSRHLPPPPGQKTGFSPAPTATHCRV